jgi:hypothetical protein
MSLTVATQDFTLLISAAKLTAYSRPDEDGVLSGLYLYTTTGESGEEVGTTNLLVAVGFDGVTVGQFAVPVSGQLPHPILVPHRDTGWLAAMCNKAKLVAGKTDKDADHTVELVVSGNSLKVTTLTDGEPAEYDVDGRCPILDTSQYPVTEADNKLKSKSLNPSAAAAGNPDALVHVLGQTALNVMKNAAKVLKHPIRVFPSATNGGPVVMTDGERWRAVTSVEPYSGDTEGRPDIEPINVPVPPITTAHTN